jgi:hypothetical protein
MEYIIETEELFHRFAYLDHEGKVIWKPGACHDQMHKIHQLQQDLFVPTATTVGGQVRGMEWLSHLIRNISGGSARNILSLFGILTARGSFNKTSHATNNDVCMARIPLILVGRLWIRFLAYLRPLFVHWQIAFRPHMAFNASHFFLTGLNRPLATADISVKLSATFDKAFKIKMSLGRFRQYITFVISCNSKLFPKAMIVTTSTALQFGHGGAIDTERYDADGRLPDSLDRGIYMTTARTSAIFQMLLGHPPDLLLALSAGQNRQNSIINIIDAIQEGRYVAEGQQVIGPPGPICSGNCLECS